MNAVGKNNNSINLVKYFFNSDPLVKLFFTYVAFEDFALTVPLVCKNWKVNSEADEVWQFFSKKYLGKTIGGGDTYALKTIICKVYRVLKTKAIMKEYGDFRPTLLVKGTYDYHEVINDKLFLGYKRKGIQQIYDLRVCKFLPVNKEISSRSLPLDPDGRFPRRREIVLSRQYGELLYFPSRDNALGIRSLSDIDWNGTNKNFIVHKPSRLEEKRFLVVIFINGPRMKLLKQEFPFVQASESYLAICSKESENSKYQVQVFDANMKLVESCETENVDEYTKAKKIEDKIIFLEKLGLHKFSADLFATNVYHESLENSERYVRFYSDLMECEARFATDVTYFPEWNKPITHLMNLCKSDMQLSGSEVLRILEFGNLHKSFQYQIFVRYTLIKILEIDERCDDILWDNVSIGEKGILEQLNLHFPEGSDKREYLRWLIWDMAGRPDDDGYGKKYECISGKLIPALHKMCDSAELKENRNSILKELLLDAYTHMFRGRGKESEENYMEKYNAFSSIEAVDKKLLSEAVLASLKGLQAERAWDQIYFEKCGYFRNLLWQVYGSPKVEKGHDFGREFDFARDIETVEAVMQVTFLEGSIYSLLPFGVKVYLREQLGMDVESRPELVEEVIKIYDLSSLEDLKKLSFSKQELDVKLDARKKLFGYLRSTLHISCSNDLTISRDALMYYGVNSLADLERLSISSTHLSDLENAPSIPHLMGVIQGQRQMAEHLTQALFDDEYTDILENLIKAFKTKDEKLVEDARKRAIELEIKRQVETLRVYVTQPGLKATWDACHKQGFHSLTSMDELKFFEYFNIGN